MPISANEHFLSTSYARIPFQGGFRLQILDFYDRPLIDLTPITRNSEFVEDDAT